MNMTSRSMYRTSSGRACVNLDGGIGQSLERLLGPPGAQILMGEKKNKKNQNHNKKKQKKQAETQRRVDPWTVGKTALICTVQYSAVALSTVLYCTFQR